MTREPFRRASLSALLCATTLAAQGAAAGEVRTDPGQQFDCAAVLTGPIESGDLERIRVVDTTRFAGGTRPLCLDSPGGALDEALRIADFLRSRGIPTAVDSGAECRDACALAFLGGEARSGAGKVLALDATLTFGATPGLPEALRAATERFGLPGNLATQVLALEGDETVRLERVGQARALGIGLAGYDAPGSLGDEVARRACIGRNADLDPANSRPEQPVYDQRILREDGATAHRKATYIVEAVVDGYPSWMGCEVELTGGEAPGLRVRTSADWTAGPPPDLREVLISLLPATWQEVPFGDLWQLLPDQTSLQEARALTSSSDVASSIVVDAVGPLPATTEGTEALLKMKSADRTEIQARLSLLDFDTLGVDGIFGPASRKAIADWQETRGFEPTGFLDGPQREALRRETESQYRDWLAEQAQIAADRESPAPVPRIRSPQFDAPPTSQAPQPQLQRVRVCQRNFLGELVNCRIEMRMMP
ncbi:peptidoglycan-binding protein [Maliponia aquimaris]|uniref:Putative peptidoglycan binding domain protein n=1 Tax=Maliponia aquimaris TaxID=1673631 RepID=A0A238L6H1_9RHOB|nr:peptidoglycan-binding protein [Maliponia aquimaris]SMX50599.1 Putative peptidoglycan binding domain protein [Maliponia aquimaris]